MILNFSILNAWLWIMTLVGPPVLHWSYDIEQAKTEAKNSHKLILLNFSGSDWCVPCISMEKEIFESSAFEEYAIENLILLKADFPRKKANQLSAAQTKKNESLAERYNRNGNFPFTLLLDAEGNVLRYWEGYYKKGTSSFINEIKRGSGE